MIVYQIENFGNRYEYRSNPHENYVIPPHLHEYSEIAFTLSGVTTVIVAKKSRLGFFRSDRASGGSVRDRP